MRVTTSNRCKNGQPGKGTNDASAAPQPTAPLDRDGASAAHSHLLLTDSVVGCEGLILSACLSPSAPRPPLLLPPPLPPPRGCSCHRPQCALYRCTDRAALCYSVGRRAAGLAQAAA